MKKILAVGAVAILGLISITVACDGGATPCADDADCEGKVNAVGDPAETCVDGICSAVEPQCEANLDCQLINPDSATTVENDCNACPADERCVETSVGDAVCTVDNEGLDCADLDPGSSEVEVTDAENNETFTTCLQGGTCGDNGQCTF